MRAVEVRELDQRHGGGAKKKTTTGQRKQIRALHKAGSLSIGEIAHQFKISKPTVHRIVTTED